MDNPRDLLLYVDDEEQALKYFRLIFAKDFEVITAPDADQAWHLIEQHADRLALVISDQRMPGRSGVDLLTAAKERCPRATRLLTTAYSDLASALAAVNRGAIYAYVTKPWKLEELRVVVQQALQLHHLQCERDALLAEKLSVFQNILLTDRVRTLGVAMAGLAGQVRRPLAAAAAWMRDRQKSFDIREPSQANSRDLWPAMLAQGRASAVIASELSLWVARNRGPEATTDIAAILAEFAARVPGITILERATTTLPVDRRLLAAGFSEFLRLLRSRLPTPDATVTMEVRHSSGERIIAVRLPGGDEPMIDPDHAGIAAYLAIHHHHGAITIPSWSPAGGQVEVVLGGSEDDGMDAFLERLALCES